MILAKRPGCPLSPTIRTRHAPKQHCSNAVPINELRLYTRSADAVARFLLLVSSRGVHAKHGEHPSLTKELRNKDEITVPAPRLVSVRTLASAWELTPTSVRRLLQQAGIPAYFLSGQRGGTVRYAADDVETFVRNSRGEPEPRHF